MVQAAGKALQQVRNTLDAYLAQVRQAADMLIPAGLIAGLTSVNKYGESTNVDTGIDTDVWDRANGTDDQDIWIAPTQARVHDIVSSSASDDGDPAGVGARTIRIYGLTSWAAVEVSEDIVLNGVTDVPTVNAYVIIHRMKVLTKGATSSNVGAITATAQVDGTVTAQITVGAGQTQMAIYGVPSIQDAYMSQYYASIVKPAGAARVALVVLVNPEPADELLNFLTKDKLGLDTGGTSDVCRPFHPYKKIDGPAIIKLQANANADNTHVYAGFDLILKTK